MNRFSHALKELTLNPTTSEFWVTFVNLGLQAILLGLEKVGIAAETINDLQASLGNILMVAATAGFTRVVSKFAKGPTTPAP